MNLFKLNLIAFVLFSLLVLVGCNNNNSDTSVNEQSVTTEKGNENNDEGETKDVGVHNEVVETEEKGTSEENAEVNPEESPWLGKWSLSGTHSGGTLSISDVTDESFTFDISVFNGGHTGGTSGDAKVNDNLASYKSEDGCVLNFNLENDYVLVTQTPECSMYGGVGVHFEGAYDKGEVAKDEVSLLFLFEDNKEIDHNFKTFTGEHYDKIATNMQLISENDDLDNLDARVVSGAVRGLFTIMEAIVMYDDNGHFWTAYIDNNRVVYMSNHDDFQNKVPKTIQEWHKRFSNLEIEIIEP